jgi:peptidoglycan/xylan/chitin deacetylase (PgdA/CDA1 family)
MKVIKPVSIFVILAPFIWINCSSIIISHKKADLPANTVKLTFDDGPNAHNHVTDSVLAVLKRHNVKGYFCLIGTNVERYPEIVRRIHEKGHGIVNHGYTDGFVFNKNAAEVKEDIIKCNTALGSALGITDYCAGYYRPPNGLYKPSARKVWQEMGMELLPATFYVLDAQRTGKDMSKVIAGVVRNIRKDNGGIILLHDGRDSREKLFAELARDSTCTYNRSWIPAALDSILTVLKGEGFVFE